MVGNAFTLTDGIIELAEGHTEEELWEIAEGKHQVYQNSLKCDDIE